MAEPASESTPERGDALQTAGGGSGGGISATATSSGTGDQQTTTATTASRPRQVAGDYPMRYVRWYQVNTSDIRSIGVAQAAATFFAAIGTFALSTYIDFSKDISAAESSGAKPAQFLKDVVNLAYWGWIFFWFLALMALLWQGSELRRIKSEHREVTFIGALWRLLKSKILGSNSG